MMNDKATALRLSAAETASLEALGWIFEQTGPSDWTWNKYSGGQKIATWPDDAWVRDLKTIR